MKKEYVIIIAVIALAAIWYFFFRTTTPAATSTVAPIPAGTGGTTPSTNPTATSPSQTIAPTTETSGLDNSEELATVTAWMNSLGVANKQQALSQLPIMTDMEIGELADIITNVWTGNRAQTEADTDFWNDWRVKYHILDGTYSPFNGGTEDDQQAYTGTNNQFRVKGSPIDYVF